MIASESAKNLIDYKLNNDFTFVPPGNDSTMSLPVSKKSTTESNELQGGGLEIQFSKEVNMLNNIMGEEPQIKQESFQNLN